MHLQRHPRSPLLYPDPNHQWEAMNVFNCAVVAHNDLYHMLYRAQGVDFVSRIGYAVSQDRLRWNRLSDPVVSPHNGRDDYRGVEDPRVTPLDGAFYMTYTAYGVNSFFPMIARSENLITWEDIGPLERAENKDHVLFPEKIGGRYAILHRRSPNIWIAFSDDLRTWTDHQIIMQPREDNDWDSASIGSNGVPIKTEHGWLLFYHGYEEEHIYRQSVALLDLDDPWSNIGYWGDHQIIYLLKLLELSLQFHPDRIGRLLRKRIFSYANVPYRIRPFEALLENPKHTVDFDRGLDDRIADRVASQGADGRLVIDAGGEVFLVNLLDKLFVPLFGKLGILFVEGGI